MKTYFNQSLITILVIALVTPLQSCIRYTPSRSEINQSANSDGNSSAKEEARGQLRTAGVQIAGPDAFLAQEAKLRERLNKLISERTTATFKSGHGVYNLGPGDMLAFSIYGFDDMSGETHVAPDGMASFPLIGSVRAAGLSLPQLRQEVTQQMGRFIKNPRIDISIRSFESAKVSVIGAVAKPGLYPLTREGQLLIEMLSAAGGRTDKAGNRIVLIPAAQFGPVVAQTAASHTAAAPALQSATAMQPVSNIVTGSPEPSVQAEAAPKYAASQQFGVEIDHEDLTGSIESPPLLIPLMPGDTVIVPEAGRFDVDGEVQKPGTFPLASRTSVLSAIAAAGGLTYAAKADEVEVIRDIGAGRKASISLNIENVALRGHPDIRLRDGDLVRVPSESGRFMRRQVVETINGIFRGFGFSGSVR
ncbi:MAG: SLBB domain-containing protein [Deltaproteobacteria bacterium]|nr:SLBB domain-containing protein [Deltaproteobacteria bacterium]